MYEPNIHPGGLLREGLGDVPPDGVMISLMGVSAGFHPGDAVEPR